MYIRFAGGLILLVAMALAGVALEKRALELRRILGQQRLQYDLLCERYAAARLNTQQLGAPARLLESAQTEVPLKTGVRPRPARGAAAGRR
jgi:hypothetical protein